MKKNIKKVWVPIEDEEITKVTELAIKVLGDKDKAEAWLISPLKSLNGQTPASILENDGGLEEVRALLQKIESGGLT